MSIVVGDKTFRTLKDRMYVNGEIVAEVYADDVKVYPEKDMRVVKVVGNTMVKCNRPVQRTGSASGVSVDTKSWTYEGPDLTFEASASFAAIVWGEGVEVEYDEDIVFDTGRYGIREVTPGYPSNYQLGVAAPYGYYPMAPFGLKIVGEVKGSISIAKTEMSPLTIAQPFVLDEIETSLLFGRHEWTRRLSSPDGVVYPGPDSLNGNVIRGKGFNYQNQYYMYGGASGTTTVNGIRVGQKMGGYGLSMLFEGSFVWNNSVKTTLYVGNPIVGGITINTPDVEYAVESGYYIPLYVPMTKVVYEGLLSETPDDVLHIGPEDL